MMKNKRLRIILYIAVVIILIILIISLQHRNRFTPPPSDNGSTTESTLDKELDFLPAGDNNGRIQIPTVTGLNMRAGQLEQTVDFYNPKENKREPAVSDEEALRLLKERCEVSNMAMVIGTLCRDPEIYTDEKNKSFAQYQLAVNRRYRIKEDSAETKTDYPWVKTVGEQALKDAYALKTGSQVYINGALQTREITRGTKCEYCEASYEWNDNATEIIPYSTEYLSNCIVPEKEEGETNAES